ncbi:1,4-dihydroxy-2-naphthoate octaprenyltransferase [Pullulanibacillus pueri]|uniref:1,4-dihydroxy-2-naphthoate octaprenyltransferase n=1 Tax=Pullulanibacillus pueri TaxID=1437324 RepID=A0A8J2ZYH8_9BACL|nr:1,4-dihydroxy-2-naphthoate polyprenyltransferase [Pullulanibacillus pueri]MBM7680495.1 1,4-dihydroxy-2-naphthoate octaprenyltransferase [Pullulanibacillus pueri]GGH86026.1 1,4-dihydroxy-2-naphthoate octaprenyltransferase [Pullulanibacillus pueri]
MESMSAIQKNKGWRVWWKLLRPHTLTASFIPVILGSAIALVENHIHWILFLAMLVASILIQAATNMFNEYFDYKRGLDTDESVGIGGTIVRDGVQPKTVLTLGYLFCLIATLIGVYICMASSWWLALIGTLCMMAGYFYTGGPYPIAYTPFGELVSGLFMGLILLLISYYIQTGTVTLNSVLISIPIAILCGGIMMANNIRDLDGDKEKGRRTLAILLGRQKANNFLTGMFIVSYLWIIGLLIFNVETVWMLLVFASLPKAYKAAKLFKEKTKSIQLMPAMKATSQLHTHFGFFLSIGLVLDYCLRHI